MLYIYIYIFQFSFFYAAAAAAATTTTKPSVAETTQYQNAHATIKLVHSAHRYDSHVRNLVNYASGNENLGVKPRSLLVKNNKDKEINERIIKVTTPSASLPF